MIKARNRKLSMLLVLAMLMTMFVGVGTASAANATYSVPSTPSITESDETSQVKTLGTIFVTIDEVSMLGSGQWLLVNLPSGVTITDYQVTNVTDNVYFAYSTDPADMFREGNAIKSSDRSLEINVVPLSLTGAPLTDEARFKIDIKAKVENISDALNATLAGPTGTFFPRSIVTVANVAGKAGDADVMISSVNSISEGDAQEIDIITIEEKTAETFKKNTEIKLELPRGFAWSNANVSVKGAWGIAGFNNADETVDFVTVTNTGRDGRDLLIKFGSDFTPSSDVPGRLAIGNPDPEDGKAVLEVDVDDSAKLGDVEVKVTVKHGSNTALNTNLVIAKYADFDVTVTEDEVKEVFAGQADVELGTFVIEEGVAGSILSNRTIILDLPSGVKWQIDENNDLISGKAPNVSRKKGSTNLLNDAFKAINSSKGESIRLTTGNISGDAVKAIIEDIRVDIDPDFEGDLEITVRGTAGVEGTVKVAEVVKPVKLEATNNPNVVIGLANQKAGDILIIENDVEAIMDDSSNDNNEIVIDLERGVRFSNKPTVEVTEGDLEIDSSKLIDNDNALKITVKYASSRDASTIEISDVNLTVDRTVPVGPIKAYIRSAEDNDDNSALDETNSDKSPGNVVIANVITPAQGGGVAEFKVGSNIYYVGGVAKVMDVAPYIKGDRSYVPMRYVAEMLGAEVVWDDAARTVTLTKGDDVVVFTIGSESYTVNGEAMTADVAPEIANERTMLPARYVAEAFGAVVGWDAGTRTVLIQQ